MLLEIPTQSPVRTFDCDSSASFAILAYENGTHEFHYLRGSGIIVRVTSATQCRFVTLRQKRKGDSGAANESIIVAMSPTKVGNGLYLRAWQCGTPSELSNIAFRPISVHCRYQPQAFRQHDGDTDADVDGGSPPGGSPRSNFTQFADLLPSCVMPGGTGKSILLCSSINVMAWTAVGERYVVVASLKAAGKPQGSTRKTAADRWLKVSLRAKVELYQECLGLAATPEYLLLAERNGLRYWSLHQLVVPQHQQAVESQGGCMNFGILEASVACGWVPFPPGPAAALDQSPPEGAGQQDAITRRARSSAEASIVLQQAGGRKLLVFDPASGQLCVLKLPPPPHVLGESRQAAELLVIGRGLPTPLRSVSVVSPPPDGAPGGCSAQWAEGGGGGAHTRGACGRTT